MLNEKGTNHNKPLIFISYPSERRGQAQYLSEFLEKKGFETWVDFKNIPGSQHYNREIFEAIRKSDAVVVLVCRDSDKEKGNIERELNEALNNNKPILPLAVEDIREELSNIGYYVNLPQWRYWILGGKDELNMLVDDLRKILPIKPVPQPVPKPVTDTKNMKAFFLFIAVLIMMLTLGIYYFGLKISAPTTPARITMRIKGNDVKLRAFPRLDIDKHFTTESLYSGDLVEVAEQSLQEENTWYHVYTFDGRSGWVLEQYLQKVPEAPSNPDDVFYIAEKGTADEIRSAINRGLNFNIADSFGYTPLYNAVAYNRNPEVVRLLIQQGLDVNATRTMGIFPGTLLEYAVRNNTTPEIISILLENGAKRDSKWGKYSALRFAVSDNTNPEVTKLLLEAEDGTTQELLLKGIIRFPAFSMYGYEDLIMYDNEVSLLGLAAISENVGIIKFLLEQGADVNAKNTEGMTALIAAATFSKSPEVINQLIKAGADINIQDHNGKTALITAIYCDRNTEFVELLINAGADVNHKDVYGRTALIWAALEPNFPLMHEDESTYKQVERKNKTVKLLINAGADVNVQDHDGDTALMKAAVSIIDTQDKTVEILLEARADLHAVNHDGKTAFDLLSEDSTTSIRNLLNPNTSPFRNASFDINAL